MKNKQKRAKKKRLRQQKKEAVESERQKKLATLEAAAHKRRESNAGNVVVTRVPWSKILSEESSGSNSSFSFLGNRPQNIEAATVVEITDVAPSQPPQQQKETETEQEETEEKLAKKQKVEEQGGSLFGCLSPADGSGIGGKAAASFHRRDPGNVVAVGWKHTRAVLAKDFRDKKRSMEKHAKSMKKLEPKTT